MEQKIAVIGAGVIGLTSAIRLQEKNKDYAIAIFAQDVTDNMSSRAAPAVWIPYKATVMEDFTTWAQRSLLAYQTLPVSSGVKVLDIVEYTQAAQIPVWARLIGQHIDLPTQTLPAPYTHGYSGKIHRIDSSVFIDYLTTRFKELGGVIIKKEFNTLSDVNADFNLIINCSGLGANKLVPDSDVFPIRGQYVLTDKPKNLEKITLAHVDENNYILVVPRTHDCWLGGNAIENSWDLQPDPALTKKIIANATALEPLLQNCQIQHVGIGLRPGRPEIRLAPETLSDGRIVIHNYGHSGAGFVTAFGCAETVVELVQGL